MENDVTVEAKPCRHRSERIPGSEPDIRSSTGEEFFLADKLRCALCHKLWYELSGESPAYLASSRKLMVDQQSHDKKEGNTDAVVPSSQG